MCHAAFGRLFRPLELTGAATRLAAMFVPLVAFALGAQLHNPPTAQAATRFWRNSAGSSNWNNAANWSSVGPADVNPVNNGVPALNDVVKIGPIDGLNRTITYDVTAPMLNYLTVDLTGAGTNRTTFNNSGNDLNLVDGMVVGDNGRATFNQTGGTVAYTNTSLDFVVGFHAGGDGIYNMSGSTSHLTVARGLYVGTFGPSNPLPGSVGVFNQMAGTTAAQSLILGANAGATGTYTISGGTMAAATDILVGNLGAGTLNIQNTGSVSTFTLSINNQGHVNLTGGTLRFDSYSVAAGGTFNYSAGTIQLDTNRFLLDDGSIETLFGDEPLIPSNKGLTIEGAAFLQGSSRAVKVAGGKLTVQSRLDIGYVLITPQGDGQVQVTNGGNLTTGSCRMGVDSAFDAPNGLVTVSGAGSSWTNNTDLTISYAANANLSVLAGGTVTSNNTIVGAVSSRTGAVTVSGPGSTLTSNNMTVGSTGTGTVTIADQGLVNVPNSLTISATGTINLQGGTLRINTVTGLDRLNFLSGTIQLPGDRNLGADTTINTLFGAAPTITTGKGLTVEGIATVPTALTLDGGTLSVGNLVNNGAFSFIAGTLAVTQAGANLNFPIVTGSPSTININANNVSLGSASSLAGFNHQGVFNVGANTVTLNSAGYAKLGVLTSITGGAINAPNGVALGSGSNLQGSGTVSARVTGELGSVIETTGALALGDAMSPAGFNYAGELRTKQFVVTLNSAAAVGLGNLTTLGSGASPGTLNAANGYVVDFDEAITGFGTINSTNTLAKRATINGTVQGTSPAQPITLSGYIKGTGSFTNVVFTGVHDPGLSPTLLTVGNVAYASTALLNIELGGTTRGSAYDAIVASGSLSLGGDLQLSLINGFTPAAGNYFDILDWVSLAGTFSSLSLPTLSAGLGWNTSQLYTSGVLSVVSAGLAGDYNGNGIVDAADYTVWRDSLGRTGAGLAADGDGDGSVTPADYNLWKTNFGAHSGSGATVDTSASVPEPPALVLLLSAAAGAACAGRNRRTALWVR